MYYSLLNPKHTAETYGKITCIISITFSHMYAGNIFKTLVNEEEFLSYLLYLLTYKFEHKFTWKKSHSLKETHNVVSVN